MKQTLKDCYIYFICGYSGPSFKAFDRMYKEFVVEYLNIEA